MSTKPWILMATGAAAIASAIGWLKQDAAPPDLVAAAVPETAAQTTGFRAAPFGSDIGLLGPVKGASGAATLRHVPPIQSEVSHLRWGLPEDPAEIHRLVQMAFINQQPDTSAKAALIILNCIRSEAMLEAQPDSFGLTMLPWLSNETMLQVRAYVARQVRACQALDSYDRAQLVPFAAIGLQREVVGNAAEIVSAAVSTPSGAAIAAQAIEPLRRDARQCHEGSMIMLYGKADTQQGWLTVDERVAYWQVLKARFEAKADQISQLMLKILAQPPAADQPAEVQRIVAEISDHC
jgi:hypothetical protein